MIYVGIGLCLVFIAGLSFKMGLDAGAKAMLDYMVEEALKAKATKDALDALAGREK